MWLGLDDYWIVAAICCVFTPPRSSWAVTVMIVVPEGKGPMKCRNAVTPKIVDAVCPLIMTTTPGAVDPEISMMCPCRITESM
jgi:hypothetical protein